MHYTIAIQARSRQGISKRKAKHSRKVQFERSGAQVRYEEEQPSSQKAESKGTENRAAEELRKASTEDQQRGQHGRRPLWTGGY